MAPRTAAGWCPRRASIPWIQVSVWVARITASRRQSFGFGGRRSSIRKFTASAT